MKTNYPRLMIVAIVFSLPLILAGSTSAQSNFPLTEEFISTTGFTFTDPDLFIQDGKAHWTIYNDEGVQYLFRDIPEFSGDVRLTVTGQIDWTSNNCRVFAGIGNDLPTLFYEEGIGISFGYTGGGCQTRGYYVGAKGAVIDYETDGCSPTNSLWINPGTPYTATLTYSDTLSLEVEGVGVRTGTPTYDGVYNKLFVGFPGGGDWPECGGSIEQIIVEPLSSSSEIPDGRITFTSWSPGNLELYYMNSDGSDLNRLTYNLAGDDNCPM